MTQHRGTRGGKQTRNYRSRMEELTAITIKPRVARGFVSMMNQEAKARGITWNEVAALVIEVGITELRKRRLEGGHLSLVPPNDDSS